MRLDHLLSMEKFSDEGFCGFAILFNFEGLIWSSKESGS